MEKAFTHYLHQLRDQAESEATPETSPELAATLEERADHIGGDIRWQEEVYLKQLDKQAEMHRLQEAIARLDSQTEREAFARHPGCKVYFQEGQYRTEHGEYLSLGDILTGGEWGHSFALDPDTVPRPVRKRFLVESAKQELRNLTDWQIYFDRTSGSQLGLRTQETYARALEERDHPPFGLLLERMVRTFLKKLSYDYDLNYTVQEANLRQDIEQKIDFIIHRRDHRRGVRFAESAGPSAATGPSAETGPSEEDPHHIGVQFTVNTNPDILSHKERQVAYSKRWLLEDDRIDDIVVAALYAQESSQLGQALRAWQNRRSARTPDSYLPEAVREHLFKKLLGNTRHIPPEEIEAEWQRVAGGRSSG
jgi:hypothetical protein